jgi:positive regulator of sigma E activity
MRDNATVIGVRDNLAWVKVSPRVACCECSARALCAGQKDNDGRLAVCNPLHAAPGDEVEIEVPERNYHRELIAIFGFLLLASLAGLAAGHFLLPLRHAPVAVNGFLGLLAGLALAAYGIFRYYRSQNKTAGFPVIVEVLKKGEFHGQT